MLRLVTFTHVILLASCQSVGSGPDLSANDLHVDRGTLDAAELRDLGADASPDGAADLGTADAGTDGAADLGTADAATDDSAAADASAGCEPSGRGTGIPTLGPTPSFSLSVGTSRPVFRQLTASGIAHYPDLSVSFRRTATSWEVYLSAQAATYRLAGPNLDSLTLTPQPVLSPSGAPSDPHHGYAGSSSVFDCGGELVMILHGENHHLPAQAVSQFSCAGTPYYATMNRATSSNGGMGFVVDSPSPVLVSSSGGSNWLPARCAYGAGGASVVPVGDYLFQYYFDWNAAQQGLHLARACRDGCGAPGTWRKYHDGGFSDAPAAASLNAPSGPSTALLPVTGGNYDAFVTVSRNTYLGAYLMVSANKGGFSLRTSADGISWTARVPLLGHLVANNGTSRVLYPTIVDASTNSRSVTGRFLTLYFGRETNDHGAKASHRAYAAQVELTKTGDVATQSAASRLALARYVAGGDHWVTTGAAAGYTWEADLGRVAANSIPGTAPLHDCVAGNDHFLSRSSDCEGTGVGQQISGHVFSSGGTGRWAIYRCKRGQAGQVDHFVSRDPDCEGSTVEGLLGYVE